MNKALIAGLLVPLSLSFTVAAEAANFNEAVKLYRAKDYPKALAELKSCDKKYPANTLIKYYLGLTHQQMGHISQAKANYKWVADNGDTKFRKRAQTGYDQLSGLNSRRASSGSSSSISSASASKVSKGKVKKVLEFYADW